MVGPSRRCSTFRRAGSGPGPAAGSGRDPRRAHLALPVPVVPDHDALASRGWVVLAPNYRGSSGYGREWQHANRFEIGRGDTMDVAAGVDYLVGQGLADPAAHRRHRAQPRRLPDHELPDAVPRALGGGSAVVPFLNWFTSHAGSRGGLAALGYREHGRPGGERGRCGASARPIFFLDRIQAPVQLICGANDPRCPASKSLAGPGCADWRWANRSICCSTRTKAMPS